MSAERLRASLAARGRDWPAPLEHFEALRSTNERLRERARQGVPAWSAVVAGRQTAGRGRQGHAWISPPGNLYLSVLLRPALPAEQRTLVPLLAGLAVAEAVAEFGVHAELKWPNDVLAANRKLAGVLAEASSSGEGVEAVVLGIGVNVAVDPAALDRDLADRATSIRAMTGAAPPLDDAAAAVLVRLFDRYAELVAGGSGALLHAWRARSVPWWGRSVEVVSGGEVVCGRARDIDERGALLLTLDDGSQLALLSGEARELRLREVGGPAS